MKINRLIIAVVVITAGAAILNACKKKEYAPPVITLLGANTITQSLPFVAGTATWTDPGFTATDPQDGNITSLVVVGGDTVKPNLKGSYYITYTVTDKEGNVAPARERVVNVVNDAEIFAGQYTTSTDTSITLATVDSLPLLPFPTITTSDSVDDAITITNFGGLDPLGYYPLNATLTGSVLNIPTPQMIQDSASVTAIISCTILSAIAPTAMDVKYQWTKGTDIMRFRR